MWRPDVALFRAINNLAGEHVALDALGIFAASHLIIVMGALLLAPIALAWREHRLHVAAATMAARALVALVLALAVNAIIHLFYFRPRPFVALRDASMLVPMSPERASFPSGHAAAAFALAFSAAFARPRFGAVLLVLAAAVSLGRIYVGVHYPLDVLAGAAVGFFSALVLKVVGPRLKEIERIERLLFGKHKRQKR
jgi:undecaprenyl-diphosphatase